MKRSMTLAAVLGLACLAVSASHGQRFRGRVGGFHFGGGLGGFRAGGFRSGAILGPYGGSAFHYRAGRTAVSPIGGVARSGVARGSYTTPRGGSIRYGGAARGVASPFGGAAGRYVGGVRVTTPSGQTYRRAGTGAGAVGAGGRAVGGRTTVRGTTGPYGTARSVYSGRTAVGPYGSLSSRYRGGVAVGPYGAAAGRAGRVTARGPYGAVTVGGRTGVAVGPYGAVSGRRGVVATGLGRGVYGTYHVSGATLAARGVAVRRGFTYYNAFTPAWYARYPGAWRAVRWTTPTVWVGATWPVLYAYCGFPATPVYYNYGSNVVYQDNRVYIDGEPVATAQQYSQQATQIANAGREAMPPAGEEWQPLGVFAMVRGNEETSSNLFQLAIDKAGVLRGNYYDAFTDTTLPITGSVDKKTQRAAWTVGDKKYPVYEAGIANLTKGETTLLVHYDKDTTRQFTLVRIDQDKDKEKK
jgi:hypothetical protein